MIYDFLIIGAGISGASAAYELSASGSTVIVEAELFPGYHSTGRSAALYTPNYGPDLVRLINKQSHDFFYSPPEGFADHPLLSPRGMMTVALRDQQSEFKVKMRDNTAGIDELNAQEVLSRVPFLQINQVVGGAYENGVYDMDVNAIHQGYLRGFAKRGGKLLVNSPVISLQWLQNHWAVNVGEQTIEARTVVNAAGAWADEVGRLAGAKSIGLTPKRRTAAMIDAPLGINLDEVPALDFMGCNNYIKPEKYQLMVSPGDEKPVAAQDIQPDDFDIAVLVEWVESITQINVSKINHQWAGLRCFVRDGKPVVGFDSEVKNFFWLAGQGGYGIMMAPALAIATAELLTNQCLPSNFLDVGIDAQSFSPTRLVI
ncbi:MAG: D-arginine dehydrogenase [Granulosicoccus sp.]|jgi:D-arginine dehydrogenase